MIYHPRWLQIVKLAPSNLHWPSETQFLAVWSTLQHQTEPIVKIQTEKQVTDLCQFTTKLNSRVLVPGIKIKQQNQFCKNFILSLKLLGVWPPSKYSLCNFTNINSMSYICTILYLFLRIISVLPLQCRQHPQDLARSLPELLDLADEGTTILQNIISIYQSYWSI